MAPLRKKRRGFVTPGTTPEQFTYEDGIVAGEIVAHAASWNIHMVPEYICQYEANDAHYNDFKQGVEKGIRLWNNKHKAHLCTNSAECAQEIKKIQDMR